MEINGNSHSAIKKTLEIYSVISNVNKGMLQEDLTEIEDTKESEEPHIRPLLAIEDK